MVLLDQQVYGCWLVISERSTGLANCLQLYKSPLLSRSSHLPFSISLSIALFGIQMTSTDAIIVEKTPPLDAPQRVQKKAEAEDGQLTHSPINHILTRVPGEKHGESGGSSDELWKRYLEEIEKQDNEMIERWKGEADSTIIFVCAGPTTLSSSSI